MDNNHIHISHLNETSAVSISHEHQRYKNSKAEREKEKERVIAAHRAVRWKRRVDK